MSSTAYDIVRAVEVDGSSNMEKIAKRFGMTTDEVERLVANHQESQERKARAAMRIQLKIADQRFAQLAAGKSFA